MGIMGLGSLGRATAAPGWSGGDIFSHLGSPLALRLNDSYCAGLVGSLDPKNFFSKFDTFVHKHKFSAILHFLSEGHK